MTENDHHPRLLEQMRHDAARLSPRHVEDLTQRVLQRWEQDQGATASKAPPAAGAMRTMHPGWWLGSVVAAAAAIALAVSLWHINISDPRIITAPRPTHPVSVLIDGLERHVRPQTQRFLYQTMQLPEVWLDPDRLLQTLPPLLPDPALYVEPRRPRGPEMDHPARNPHDTPFRRDQV